MLYFPIDFVELTIDGLIDTGALSSATAVPGFRKIRLSATQPMVKTILRQLFKLWLQTVN